MGTSPGMAWIATPGICTWSWLPSSSGRSCQAQNCTLEGLVQCGQIGSSSAAAVDGVGGDGVPKASFEGQCRNRHLSKKP
eukprot:2499989-Prymnesium_polylepis.1